MAERLAANERAPWSVELPTEYADNVRDYAAAQVDEARTYDVLERKLLELAAKKLGAAGAAALRVEMRRERIERLRWCFDAD